ncbi:20402_t:CDS:2 [Rhizophagus irregularis]|nr:20402_t:CDS:2 [Rhizophagus irregularis]
MEIALNCIFLGNCYAFSVKVCYINVIGDKAHVNSQLMTQVNIALSDIEELKGVTEEQIRRR